MRRQQHVRSVLETTWWWHSQRVKLGNNKRSLKPRESWTIIEWSFWIVPPVSSKATVSRWWESETGKRCSRPSRKGGWKLWKWQSIQMFDTTETGNNGRVPLEASLFLICVARTPFRRTNTSLEDDVLSRIHSEPSVKMTTEFARFARRGPFSQLTESKPPPTAPSSRCF